MAQSDILHFFGAWLRAPLRVASVTPSGTSLSAMMTKHVQPGHGRVLELGPGTGVLTYALLRRGVAERDITLVESGNEFVPLLNQRFPHATILHMDAKHLWHSKQLPEDVYASVISGLPLLQMSAPTVVSILRGSFKGLRRDGAFYQLTYGPKCPVPSALLSRLDLKAERIGWTFRNVPPAAVYRISRREVGGFWDGR